MSNKNMQLIEIILLSDPYAIKCLRLKYIYSFYKRIRKTNLMETTI